jgi:cation diffusion facilitator family transporter
LNDMLEKVQDELKAGRRVTLVGAAVNLILAAFKFLAGVFGSSAALIADAVHSLSDLATDVVVLVGLKLGRAPADQKHQFGHGRLETLTAALVGLALLGTGVFLGYESGVDIYHHAEHHPTWLAVVGALVSVITKEALYRWTMAVGKRIQSAAVQANAWHHRTDALSSVAVLIGVGAAIYNPAWHILDAYAALVVSLLVCKAGLDIVWDAIKEFTDHAPTAEVLEDIQRCALNVEGVREIHDLKVRAMGGRFHMELHVVVNGSLSVLEGHAIAKEVEACLIGDLPLVERVIIHIDPEIDAEKETDGP